MNILGINAYHGNASAAIVCEGRLIAAVEEERFNRVKYAAGFPALAIRYCLKEAGLTLGDIDHVAVPRNPYARLFNKLNFFRAQPVLRPPARQSPHHLRRNSRSPRLCFRHGSQKIKSQVPS